MADEERIDPEEDPEAALEALAEAPAPESPARRRRLARAALYGMRDARRPSAEQGYAIGVDRVREVLADFRDGRSRAWFGAGLLTPPAGVLERRHLPSGLLLTAAEDGTSAADLRLEQVLLTRVDGRRIGSSLADYCRAAGDAESGDERKLTVIAGGRREQTVAVEFN